jgi:hypothetical protein
MRTVFAIAIATLIVAAIPGTAQSAPIPPLPAGIMVHPTDLTEVAWRRCWRDRWVSSLLARPLGPRALPPVVMSTPELVSK